MATATFYGNAPDLSPDDYLVVGLATCFLKEDGEVRQVEILEPIPAAALEAIVKGIPTSYQFVCGTTLGAVLGETPQKPEGFPASAEFADEFTSRAIAAARTYKRHEQAKSCVAPGTIRRDLNYSIERKRVLNPVRIVTKDDNVKQHSHTHKIL